MTFLTILVTNSLTRLQSIMEPDAIDALKKDLGVEETDTKDLNGTNFNVGVYFKLEI